MPRSTATMPRPLAILLAALLLQACAGGGTESQQAAAAGPATGAPAAAPPAATRPSLTEEGDPLEPINRKIFDFNLAADDHVIRPAAEFYRDNLGPWVRTRIRNVIRNMDEPRYMANSLLQGQPLLAGQTLMRFVINSTMGLGGMFDMEQFGGPPRTERDFGQTLYVWGLPAGPFIMIPILGPSNPRDIVGSTADGFLNPINWLMPFYGNASRGLVDGIDIRAENIESLDELRSGSLDFYARLRSVWQQHRDAQLRAVTGEGPAPVQDFEILEDPGATQ
ncbi:MAG: VacJ family lipoprotein [Acetobacteraceae bacterium]|nr:VacJ family lipoprotein [Acetobacteraceae bacterium]